MELKAVFSHLNAGKKYPHLFKGLTKDDFNLLANSFWDMQGPASKKLTIKQTFYNHTGDEKMTQREIRWIYKCHVGIPMSDYDYPNH